MTRDDLLGVLRPFGEATPLPREAFVDPDVLDLEQRALFSSSWIPVAHEADLKRPGATRAGPPAALHASALSVAARRRTVRRAATGFSVQTIVTPSRSSRLRFAESASSPGTEAQARAGTRRGWSSPA